MKKILLALLCLGLSCVAVDAQKKWTLRECVEYALENNIQIKQQEIAVEQSDIRLNTSRNSRLPDLSAGIGQNFNFGRSQLASGMYEDFRSTGTSLSVSSSIPVFAGMRINNTIKSNKFNLLAATENLQKAKENLELQVTSLYLNVLFKREIKGVFDTQYKLTFQQSERTKALVESGKVPKSQFYDIMAELAKSELNIITSSNDMELSLLNLAQALNITDLEFDVVEPEANVVICEYNYSVEEIYQTALEIKPHVREAQYRLEGSKSDLKVAKSVFWPTVSLGLSYSTLYNHIFKLAPPFKNESFSTQFKNNQGESIRLSVSIPIFNRLSSRNQTRSARLDIRSRELELDNVKMDIYKEIRQAYQSAIASESKYYSTRKAYDAAEEAFVYAEERYNVGKMTVYEFNDILTKLLTSSSERLQAKYDFIFRSKILDFYRGVKIDIE